MYSQSRLVGRGGEVPRHPPADHRQGAADRGICKRAVGGRAPGGRQGPGGLDHPGQDQGAGDRGRGVCQHAQGLLWPVRRQQHRQDDCQSLRVICCCFIW